jgi:lysophospholipase L1-like esterase
VTGSAGEAPLRYVALGDSYTIGTAIEPADCWPDGLVGALAALAARGDADRGPQLELVANLGVNGFTSADLIRDELAALARLRPDVVSLLIGVNDVVQRVPEAVYRANVTHILDTLLAALPADRLFAVAIPDYTVTPAGADYGDPRQQHDGIMANNAVMAELTAARGIAFIDIFDLSLDAATDRRLVADDGLHPSAAQYARWVERIAPVVAERLRGSA